MSLDINKFEEGVMDHQLVQSQEMLKSLFAEYNNFSGGDSTLQTGFSAFRKEDLDDVAAVLSESVEQSSFWRNAKKGDAATMVKDIARKDNQSWGGPYADGGLPDPTDELYDRIVRNLKYYGIRGKVTFPAESTTKVIEDAKALEFNQKVLSLTRTIDVAGMFGFAGVNSLHMDGIIEQHRQMVTAIGYQDAFIVDLQGAALTPEHLNNAVGMITEVGYGDPNNITLFWSPGVKNEFNNTLGSTNRQVFIGGGPNVIQNVGTQLGMDGKRSLYTSHGDREIKTIGNIHMRNKFPIKTNEAGTSLLSEGSQSTATATTITVGTITGTTGGKLALGSYRYAVVAVTSGGKAAGVETSGAAVIANAGEYIPLSIANTDATVTGYILYRVLSADFANKRAYELIDQIPNTNGAKTYQGKTVSKSSNTITYHDLGEHVQKTADIFLYEDNAEQVFKWYVAKMMQEIELGLVADYRHWIWRIYSTPFLKNAKRMVVFKNVKSTNYSVL